MIISTPRQKIAGLNPSLSYKRKPVLTIILIAIKSKRQKMKQSLSGFTLIELLITIGMVGILAMIALPSYQQYTRRAYYSELVQAAAPYKLGVTECYQETGSLDDCQAGINYIPPGISTSHGMVARSDVKAGVISLTPVERHGLKENDDYVLTPIIVDDVLVWKISGGGVVKGYVKS